MHSRDHVQGVPYVTKGPNLCMLPWGLRCMGCCGLDFAKKLSSDAKTRFVQALVDNTREFQANDSPEDFRTCHASYDLHACGMCRKLIIEESGDVVDLADRKHLRIMCPLHPACNDGKELRRGECDPEYMCGAQRQFHTWEAERQERFIAFIEKLDPDWFAYSVGMQNDSLIKEFLEDEA